MEDMEALEMIETPALINELGKRLNEFVIIGYLNQSPRPSTHWFVTKNSPAAAYGLAVKAERYFSDLMDEGEYAPIQPPRDDDDDTEDEHAPAS